MIDAPHDPAPAVEEKKYHPNWGGRRKGAGRKARGPRPIDHTPREPIPSDVPVYVKFRTHADIKISLRTRRAFHAVARVIWDAQGRFGMQITHFAMRIHGVHMIVEGLNEPAMQGLGVRLSKGINRLMERKGTALGERYEARPLRTSETVRDAIHRVMGKHRDEPGLEVADEFSSVAQPQLARPPRTQLLLDVE